MVELDGEADAEHVIQAGTGQAEPRREADPHVSGELPAEHRREVLRRVAERQRPGVSDTPVGFSTGDELLGTEGAYPAGRTMQGMSRCHRIPKLPRRVRQVFFRDEVLGEVPTLNVRRKDQSELRLVVPVAFGHSVGIAKVALAVVADEFKNALVGAGDAFVLDVEYRVDDVFAAQWPEPVLEAVSGEQ